MDKEYRGYILRINAIPFDLPILVNGVLQKTVHQGYRPNLVISKDHGNEVRERIFHPEGVFATPAEAESMAEKYGKGVIEGTVTQETTGGL